LQEDGFNVYTYSIPVFSRGYQVPPDVDDSFYYDVVGQWVNDIFYPLPGSYPELALGGVEILAIGNRVSPNIINVGGSAAFLVSIGLATVAAQTAAENYDFGPPSTYGAYDAAEVEARILVADGAGGYTPATEWKKLDARFLSGPDFIIADACPVKAVTITQSYSVQFPGKLSHTQNFDFSQVLDPNLVIIEDADWSIDYNYANTVVNTEFGDRTARSGQIDRTGFIWIEAASDNASKIVPPPAPGYPSVNNSGGLWNHANTNQYFNLNVPVGPHSFAVPGDSVKLKMIDTNPTSLTQYSEPFRVAVAGWSAHNAISYGFASSPPVIIDFTALNVSATISIKVYYRKR
jgi:hypothetical protein